MSLSNKYGGNVDIMSKYGVPRNDNYEELSRQAELNPNCVANGTYGRLPREIEVENRLDAEHLSLLRDAYNEIDKSRFRSVREAYEAGKIESGHLQVWSKWGNNLVLVPFTNYICHEDEWTSPDYYLKSRSKFENDYNLFYSSGPHLEKEVIIKMEAGTYDTIDDLPGRRSYCVTDMVFFVDGCIYLQGGVDINKIPVDVLSRVLDEAIAGLNRGESKRFLQTIRASIAHQNNANEKFKLKGYSITSPNRIED